MNRLFVLLALPAIVVAGCKTASDDHKHEQWTCPMHPQYVSDKPGDCPICGMKLVPKREVAAPSTGVAIDAERQKLLGLRTVEIKIAPIAGGIRTTGRITPDERKAYKVTARFEGFVEKLHADFTGKLVKKGDPLLSIYSPDLLATQEEYLLAVRSKAVLAQSGLPDAARAARDRLRLFGISEGEIDRLEKRGTAERTMTLHAPIAGFVTTKTAVAGAKVAPDDPLFEIVDLSRLWVMADVYEYELPRLKLGQRATLSLSYWPGRAWEGKVTHILPTVDPKTRTVKVRIEVDNAKNELKPEMYGDVVIETAAREALVIPEDAVVVTGVRKVAFVLVEEGKLQPRTIETGAQSGGVYEVKSGLRAGERVAAGASFLLDSEARLRSVMTEDGRAP
jgi:membrane fusion protein, copper/silver efflux system